MHDLACYAAERRSVSRTAEKRVDRFSAGIDRAVARRRGKCACDGKGDGGNQAFGFCHRGNCTIKTGIMRTPLKSRGVNFVDLIDILSVGKEFSDEQV